MNNSDTKDLLIFIGDVFFVSFHGCIRHRDVRELFVLSLSGAVHLRNAELPWLTVLTLRKPGFVCRLSVRRVVCQEPAESSHEGRKVKF